jgi:DNA-binding transcriptional ArsR family regulator
MKGKLQVKKGDRTEEKDVEVLFFKKKYYYGKGEFIVMNKDFAGFLKKKLANSLTGLDIRVMMALIERTEQNNRIKLFKQKNLAEELSTTQQNISRSIKRLKDHGIIEEKGDFPELYFDKRFIYTGGMDGEIEELGEE